MPEHLKVAWYDFEPEPEMTGDGSGNPETHYLTIAVVEKNGSKGDEVAVICHRLVGGKYPLDGDTADEKRRNAQTIVDALNHEYGAMSYADQFHVGMTDEQIVNRLAELPWGEDEDINGADLVDLLGLLMAARKKGV